MARVQLTLLLIFSLALSACSVKTVQPMGQTFTPSQSFIASGKLGIRTGELSESARFIWMQDQERFRVQLLDPFGRNALVLEGDDSEVQLQLSGEEQAYTAASPEELMEEVLGWRVPIQPASFWIQGVPSPGIIEASRSSSEQFEQQGWRVEVRDRAQLSGKKNAPRRVLLERDNLRITLIFAQWD